MPVIVDNPTVQHVILIRTLFYPASLLILMAGLFSVSAQAQTTHNPRKRAGLSVSRPPLIRSAVMHSGGGTVQFCGEIVPIEQAAVGQKLAVALMSSSGYAQHINALRQRSAPYFAVIDPILRKHNIPADFRYLPIIESDWKANAVSSAGAVGYWQFMDETARDMGLKITPEQDERQDLLKSTDAACRYLNDLYRNLRSWTLVAAAYNGGVGMIQRKMIREGHRDYYRLALNEETSYYLYRILAIKELFTNPGRYTGLTVSPMAYLDNPYERERDQARRMGWLNDQDADPVGVPIESSAPAGEIHLMDSVLVDLLKNKPAAVQIFTGDVEARLVKAGSLKVGQSWSFILTQDTRIDEDDLKAGDTLYAIVDDIDGSGTIYLRATKAIDAATKDVIPLRLTALNPATGLAGVPLPKSLKPGWIVQFSL